MSIRVDIVCNDCSASCYVTHDLDKDHYDFILDTCPFCGADNIELEEIEEE